MRITPKSLVAGVRWRVDKLYERLPRGVRVWMTNRTLNSRIRRGQTSYDRTRLMRTFREALQTLATRNPGAPVGAYLEFGVYHGTSMSCMHAVRAEAGLSASMRMFGFDSFEGLPESAASEDEGVWAPGMFVSSVEFTRSNLRRWGVPDGDITLIKGWFNESLTPETRARHDIQHASVLMVDCDLYSSTQSVLAFAAPLIRQQAVFVFDDWDSGDLASKDMGEARAFREFLAAHPEFSAEELSGLNYKDKAGPRVFLVMRA